MAIPGPTTIDSLVPQVEGFTANYTQDTPAESDRVQVQYRLVGAVEWDTLETTNDTNFTVVGLEGFAEYECRVRGVNNIDGSGPWSNTLSVTTLQGVVSSFDADFSRIFAHLLPRGRAFDK